jgi:hypothetical protein
MGEDEFQEWLAYFQLEPWGTQTADQRAAIIASTIANVNRSAKQRAFTIDDFMPRYAARPHRRRQTPQEMRNLFAVMTRSVGGTYQKA